MKLEELRNILQDNNYFYMGHGTGRSGDGDEVVQAIFEEGLRTKGNSLYYTTVGLDTSNLETLKEQLNNWQHLNSKRIIIIRVPLDYINKYGDAGDLAGERYGAFLLEREDSVGKKINYLNPKFIVGCYNVEKEMIKLNPKFEETLTEESLKEMKDNYEKTVEKMKARLKRLEEGLVLHGNYDIIENAEIPEINWDDIDWDKWDDDFDWSEDKDGKSK